MKGRNDFTENWILNAAIIIFGSLIIGTCYCLYSFGNQRLEIHTASHYSKTEMLEVVSIEELYDAVWNRMKYNVTVSLGDKEDSIETYHKCELGEIIPVDVWYYYWDGELVEKESMWYYDHF